MRTFSTFLVCLVAMLAPHPASAQSISAEDRRAVVTGAAALIEARYVDPDKGRAVAATLRAEADTYRETDPKAFAAALTGRLRASSGDGHFAVEHRTTQAGQNGLDAAEAEHSEASLERWYGVGVNHGFEAVRRLDGGIGYLDLRVFPPLKMGGDMLTAAMTLLAQSPALIIDLRQNGGGMGEAVGMLAAHLLDDSVELSAVYDRPTDRLTRAFTPSWVPGRRFGPDKPVYVLTSRRTFSAAEAFAYDMQAIKRATIVGERSGGGAHPFEYRSITPNFILSLPERRSINPVTRTDWEGVGVEPDVEVPADEALEQAMSLAKREIAAHPLVAPPS